MKKDRTEQVNQGDGEWPRRLLAEISAPAPYFYRSVNNGKEIQ
jgi:hypothetical protein